jgi:transcriptional regulator with XRE-family HTH domain
MNKLHTHPLSAALTRRKMHSVTAAQAAKVLGMQVNSYYRLERGERVAPLPKALTLAHLLNCTVEQLSVEPSVDEQVDALRASLEKREPRDDWDEIADRLDAPNRDAGSVVAAQVPVISDVPLDPYMGRIKISSGLKAQAPGLPDDLAAILREAEEDNEGPLEEHDR